MSFLSSKIQVGNCINISKMRSIYISSIFIVLATAASDLSYDKVRLVDNGNNTWLFRTNLPLVNGSYVYEEVVSYMG